MSKSSNNMAREATLKALRDPICGKINFKMNGHSVSSTLLRDVAKYIENKKISVVYDPNIGGKAEYDLKTNTIHLRLTKNSMTGNGIIVHECVHAGFDMLDKSKMRVATSEAAAYIAQCVYVRAKCKDPNQRLMSKHKKGDKVFELAWEIAGGVLKEKNPTDKQVEALQAAVLQHPNYSKAGNCNAGYDGVD